MPPPYPLPHIFFRGEEGFRCSGFLNYLILFVCLFAVTFIFQNAIYTKSGEKVDPWERKKTVQNSLIQNLTDLGDMNVCSYSGGLRETARKSCSPRLFSVYIRPSPSCILRTGYPDLNNKGNNVRPPDEGLNCFFLLPELTTQFKIRSRLGFSAILKGRPKKQLD